MKIKSLFLLLFCYAFSIQAQYRGLFLPDNKGGTTLATNEKRIALIIGNQNYSDKGWNKLFNPINDAQLMKKTLENVGFEVQLLTDANRQQMLNGISAFVSKVSGTNTIAFFFFAGHGIEYKGNNYLIAADDVSSCIDQVGDYNIDLTTVHDKLKNKGTAVNIIVLDACRNQPKPLICDNSVKRGNDTKTFGEYRPQGSYIAFSAAPGQLALDGVAGSNSPFTTSLAKNILIENQKLEEVFTNVRREINSKGQRVWTNNDFLGDFYFKYKTNTNIVNINNGAQDSDNDGVVDSKDECPNEYGEVSNNGCPNNIGIWLKKGEDFIKKNDCTNGIKWYEKAAEKNNTIALKNLAELYLWGGEDGECQTIKNRNEGIKWYKKAAELGDIEAMEELGEIYYNLEINESIKWYKKAAELGSSNSIETLANVYYKGTKNSGTSEKIITPNYIEAVKWCKKAVTSSKYADLYVTNLALIYQYGGYGLTPDYKEALKWGKMSSSFEGNIAGLYFEGGYGLEINPKEVKEWYNKICFSGNCNILKEFDDNNTKMLAHKKALDYAAKNDFHATKFWMWRATELGFEWSKVNNYTLLVTELAKQEKDISNKELLGHIYLVQKDLKQAKYWYQQACNKGSKLACEAITRYGL